ncbi:MAG: ribosome small subunit-dependent GTPase A [Flavobacteriales bacterium]|nr:ribosome small subunit-dependent GTPase A [Flavobacteriales bacterium]MDG1348265.1 ribosome small subunit-dependent GTPase A [Flavobacteriales bacterium]|tara:strand:- start:2903 stop:3829 length:927 start_codon:yes stop_codon:yes gene_type:complete
MNAVVIKTTGKRYTVKTETGDVVHCRLKGKFRIAGIKSTNPIVVGDKVEVVQESELWMIVRLHDRKNHILRKSVNLSKQTHIIAANIDQAILMITLDSPITTTGFIDRFLVAANAYGVKVVLIFNKVDLLNDELKAAQNNLLNIYEGIGYTCFVTSVINDDLSEIKDLMKGKINMISGHSGVGKSTLVNYLQPNLHIDTKEVSNTHKQGQHTTTFSELHDLDFGASIIDTPGIRGFGLVELEVAELGNYFPEFFKLKSACKYHNCIHKNEPQCAIKSALAEGKVAESRYKNYLNMLEEEQEHFRTNNY